MNRKVIMPRFSDSMERGTIVAWRKAEGETVRRGDTIAEVSTDKATIELEAFSDGTLAKILVGCGKQAEVGQALALLEEFANTTSNLGDTQADQTPAACTNEAAAISKHPSPLARSLLRSSAAESQENKNALSSIARAETPLREKYAQEQPEHIPSNSKFINSTEPETISGEVSQLGTQQRFVNLVFAEAKAEVSRLESMTSDLCGLAEFSGVTKLHLIVKALAAVLEEHPNLNRRLSSRRTSGNQGINIGILVSDGNQVLTPVLKNVPQRPLASVVSESRILLERATKGTLKDEEQSDASLWIADCGKFSSVLSFAGFFRQDQQAVLSLGCVADSFVLNNNRVETSRTIHLSLSADASLLDYLAIVGLLDMLVAVVEKPFRLLA